MEKAGEFSIRGDIADIFTPDYDSPVRLDFFDDEIESIKPVSYTHLDVYKRQEISKIHEKVTFFNLSEARVEEPRGEYVLVTDGANEENALNGLSVEEHVSFYADKGMSKMEAIKQTARDRGTSKNEIYKLFFNKDENN